VSSIPKTTMTPLAIGLRRSQAPKDRRCRATSTRLQRSARPPETKLQAISRMLSTQIEGHQNRAVLRAIDRETAHFWLDREHTSRIMQLTSRGRASGSGRDWSGAAWRKSETQLVERRDVRAKIFRT
jgi:hypothetical protein